jgi:hypothetical protein
MDVSVKSSLGDEGNDKSQAFTVPLLNQFNYPEWAPKMATQLKSRGLYVWVSGAAMQQLVGEELSWEDRIKIASYKVLQQSSATGCNITK